MTRHSEPLDVIVAGAGGMGSAAAFHLARRGARELAFDAFAPPHEMGSSHGLTRIVRLSYHEHPSYVPLLRHAYELWRELESLSGADLLTITGSLEMGLPDGAVFAGAPNSCLWHDLPHEVLDTREIVRRFPAHRPPAGYVGLFQPDGAGETLALKTCLYTNTPDLHFIIAMHPECPQVVIGGGFSGHGFKFCALVGEILADLALEGATRHDISLFRLGRFHPPPTS